MDAMAPERASTPLSSSSSYQRPPLTGQVQVVSHRGRQPPADGAAVCRKRNPLRANLVRSADRWLWSSTRAWSKPTERPTWLVEGPVPHVLFFCGLLYSALVSSNSTRGMTWAAVCSKLESGDLGISGSTSIPSGRCHFDDVADFGWYAIFKRE